MRLEYQILCAFALDLLLGDPRWLPHPVRIIGRLAAMLENPLRKMVRHLPAPRLRQAGVRGAGVLLVALVLGATGLATWLIVWGAARLHPLAGDGVAIFLIYTTFAARDLADHSSRVHEALRRGDLPEARRRVGLMVGRDTEGLDEEGVTRAAVESVAENMVDGVTAPIFFAALGGPVGAMLYKAVNTLDSTFGYQNERYLHFGWASARLDDLVNFIPARLTAPLTAAAAAILGLRAKGAWRVFARDGRKHPSPNSGLAEAAVAGALGVQLGGLNSYGGKVSERSRLGDPIETLGRVHILRVNRLMFVTAFLALLIFVGARQALVGCPGGGVS